MTNKINKYINSEIGLIVILFKSNMIKICEICEIEFSCRFNNQKYCSRKCMGLARKKTLQQKCPVCNNIFLSRVVNDKPVTRTCSRKCGYEYLKIKAGSYKTCKTCDKTFYSKGNILAQYCSHKCFFKNRETGLIVKCDFCSKDVYKQNNNYKKNKNHFCNIECFNSFQKKDKINLLCKICNKEYFLSKSIVLRSEYERKYCSLECRNKDEEWVKNTCIKGNLAQLHKKGLNKLELKGREILQDIGIQDFQEQVLMFEKFCVDVLIESKKLIIQWDGAYWHTKEKRKNLDISQDAYFQKCGYKVLRITDLQIKNNINEVYENIKRAI